MQKNGKIIKEEAHVKTGALRDSITIEKESDGSRLIGVDVETEIRSSQCWRLRLLYSLLQRS